MTSTHDLRGMLRAARRRHMREFRRDGFDAVRWHATFAAWRKAYFALSERLSHKQ